MGFILKLWETFVHQFGGKVVEYQCPTQFAQKIFYFTADIIAQGRTAAPIGGQH